LYIDVGTVFGTAQAEHGHLAIRDRADADDSLGVEAFPPRVILFVPPVDDGRCRLVTSRSAC
jgi:hypothetical protein